MGRDYKDIVRELWDTVPDMLEKAEAQYEKLEEQYMAISSLDEVESDIVDELEEKLEEAEERLNRCQEMMDSLENDEFLTIISFSLLGVSLFVILSFISIIVVITLSLVPVDLFASALEKENITIIHKINTIKLIIFFIILLPL